MQQTNQQMKTLTKIRLVNWHYFTDETITIKGSALFSGENASGKSTILDAIQFVLTAGSGRFNPAANEKSKRNLRGYVRCKTGDEGNTYVRGTGNVTSYVALEFYESSKDKYFVIGVKLDSRDLEADIIRKWFCIDGPMDNLSFIVNNKPAEDREFLNDGKKIQFENLSSRARENFLTRLGRLDSKFTEMLSKSLAFKPMTKIKDFICQFVLPEKNIDTGTLKENLQNLKELQKLINEVKAQIEQLRKIIDKADEIESKEYEILVIEILIQIAKIEAKKQELENLQKKKSEDESLLSIYRDKFTDCENRLKTAQNKLNELNIALASNECKRLIERIEEEIRGLKTGKAKAQLDNDEYKNKISIIDQAVKASGCQELTCRSLLSDTTSTDDRIRILEDIKLKLSEVQNDSYSDRSKAEIDIKTLNSRANELESKIGDLKKNKMSYDRNTTALQKAINDEFSARRINSEARIFADLLEITMPEWRNAVEGYLNTQRFYIIVDPVYYDIAAEVYDRLKSQLHTVGLVNTEKLSIEADTDLSGTLAEAVHSDNRFARAYTNYVLGRVTRCDSVNDLKHHSVAITKTCMKYQGHVLSKISPDIYNAPYIGRYALEMQLKTAEKELTETLAQIQTKKGLVDNCTLKINAIGNCDFSAAKDRAGASEKIREIAIRLQKEEKELAEAKNNPSFIDLSFKLDVAEKAVHTIGSERDRLNSDITNKQRDITDVTLKIKDANHSIETDTAIMNQKIGGNLKASEDAEKKYQDEVKRKAADTIATNYGPRRQTLEHQREAALLTLGSYQNHFKDGDFGTGMEVMQLYRDELAKLEKADLISYEDKLAKAQNECELEFRENFLAKMRENIDKAQDIFTALNKSLKGIYYGNDSYKFELTGSRERQSLYEMITSDINLGGNTLFTSLFDEKYHAEMEDLFSKLTDENLSDATTINELTDYRSYLDYDIQVISRDGRMQRFSKTYGEKSGGETQTPYYVAIAASFAQMYSDRETARIIMLDEAFNNMDEDRIESMMQFFDSQNFQIILAAPPARMEIIGEHVDSIYLAIRFPEKNVSTIEEYFL